MVVDEGWGQGQLVHDRVWLEVCLHVNLYITCHDSFWGILDFGILKLTTDFSSSVVSWGSGYAAECL
jgi:hypothetical protein